MPFLWALPGIFGCLENSGLPGLCLGPALMAVLIAIWRDWIDAVEQHASYNPPAIGIKRLLLRQDGLQE
ncbi:MAG: hypothetical protein ACU837_13780 [Gammaproteobacteria bacterium]